MADISDDLFVRLINHRVSNEKAWRTAGCFCCLTSSFEEDG